MELLTDPLETRGSLYLFLPLADTDLERLLSKPELYRVSFWDNEHMESMLLKYRQSIYNQMGPLAEGLATLHELKIAHCDLTRRNILVFCSSDGDLTL